MADKLSNSLSDAIAKIGTIHYVINDNYTPIPDATWTTIATLQLPAGTYVLTGDLWFASNQNGIRIMILDITESTANDHINSVLGTGRSDLNKARIINLTTQATIYLRAYQSSGSQITARGKISAVVLK